MKTLHDLPSLKDKKVIVRVGFDVPLDQHGNVQDDKRIRLSIPTIRYLLDQGAKQIILIAHAGRPKNTEPHLRMNGIAARLSEILSQPVAKLDNWGENGLPNERIILLENLRFHPGEKSKDSAERDVFGKQLAALADFYVDDAFSNLHRDHASMTSIAKFISGYAGMAVEKEVRALDQVIAHPKRPFVAVMGGLKADKLGAIAYLLDKADHILMGGALAFSLLKAQGYAMGASKIDQEGMDEMSDIVSQVKNSVKVHLPVDAVVADQFSSEANTKIVTMDGVPDGWLALDIGPKTIEIYLSFLKAAQTIIWFGPIGVFEMAPFSQGTKAIGKAMAENPGITIVGGGDSAAAAESLGYADQMTLISTGGGASLKIIEGKKLPGLEALR